MEPLYKWPQYWQSHPQKFQSSIAFHRNRSEKKVRKRANTNIKNNNKCASSVCSHCSGYCCCLLLYDRHRMGTHRFSPLLQIMRFVSPVFTLNPFSSMASFNIKSLLTHLIAFRWWVNDGPLIEVLESFLPSLTIEKN